MEEIDDKEEEDTNNYEPNWSEKPVFKDGLQYVNLTFDCAEEKVWYINLQFGSGVIQTLFFRILFYFTKYFY